MSWYGFGGVQEFKQLFDMPNPYSPQAQPKAGGQDAARKGASAQDASRQKQVLTPVTPNCHLLPISACVGQNNFAEQGLV